MTNSTELSNLKNKLFSKGTKDGDVYNLCAVMEVCGGYSELLNLPIPTLTIIMDYLEFINKETTKGMPKAGGRGRK